MTAKITITATTAITSPASVVPCGAVLVGAGVCALATPINVVKQREVATAAVVFLILFTGLLVALNQFKSFGSTPYLPSPDTSGRSNTTRKQPHTPWFWRTQRLLHWGKQHHPPLPLVLKRRFHRGFYLWDACNPAAVASGGTFGVRWRRLWRCQAASAALCVPLRCYVWA